MRRRQRAALFALLGVVALLALACGSSKKTTDAAGTTTTSASGSSTTASDGYGSGSTSSTAAGSGAATGSASVSVGTTSLGQVIVDQQGYTLYLFEKDTGPTSTCVDACAKAWPAATVTGTPTAGTGVTGALTTTTRADGSTQLVLAGHPLYRFAADGAPGDVMGQDVGGVWYAVSPSGGTVE
ncbi:MAG: COG4315 family predicted lipoprotein [Acidimicrobiales bacterium]